jgi:2-polyprenyl-3-methyl-5-hydroxy-6-metoxy-1,4-benzoquinol methylase
MEGASRQAHWDNVYTTKGENEVSWFQQSPAPSLELIVQVGATQASAIIDIGGGASRLVDHLVEQGFEDVSVLDLSGAALKVAKASPRSSRRSSSLAGGRCHDLGAGEAIRHLARPGGVPLSHR